MFDFIFKFFFEKPLKWFLIGGAIYCLGSVFCYPDGSFNFIGSGISLVGILMFLNLGGKYAHDTKRSFGMCTFSIVLIIAPAIMRLFMMDFTPISKMNGLQFFLIGIGLIMFFICVGQLYECWAEDDEEELKKQKQKRNRMR